jgi:uncharacterized protein YggT (Ycf19 family)
MFLLQHDIVHDIINLFFAALIILMFMRFILSFFNLGESNPIMLFVVRCTEPFIAPIRKRIPPVWVLNVAFFFAWAALDIMRTLLLQALPPGW